MLCSRAPQIVYSSAVLIPVSRIAPLRTVPRNRRRAVSEQEFPPPRRPARSYRPDRDDDDPPPWANMPPVRPARTGRPAVGGYPGAPGRPAAPPPPAAQPLLLSPRRPRAVPRAPALRAAVPSALVALACPGPRRVQDGTVALTVPVAPGPGVRPGGPGGRRRPRRFRRPWRFPDRRGATGVRAAPERPGGLAPGSHRRRRPEAPRRCGVAGAAPSRPGGAGRPDGAEPCGSARSSGPRAPRRVSGPREAEPVPQWAQWEEAEAGRRGGPAARPGP